MPVHFVRLPWLAKVGAVAALYFVAARLALLMAIPPGYATAVWPAAGVALVCVLVWGYRVWPGLVIGSFLVNVGTSFDSTSALPIVKSVSIAASIGVGAALQGIAGTILVKTFIGYPNSVDAERQVLRFLVLAGPVGCLVGATWGVTTLLAAGIISWPMYGFSWVTWWVGDTIGAIIFAPLLLAFVGEPRNLWRRRRVTVALPLALGFAAITLLFVRASAWENDRLQGEFKRRAQELAQVVERRMEQYLEVGASVASFYDSNPALSRDAFHAFARGPLSRHPGIQALSWVPRVPRGERIALEEALHREGLTQFSIQQRANDGSMTRAPERFEYFPVLFIEPRGKEEGALGFDLASEAVRRATIQLSAESGQATITPPINLVQDQLSQQGFLLLVPVYEPGTPTDTPERRRRALRGFSSTVFRAGATIGAALDRSDRHGMNIAVVDEAVLGEAGHLYAERAGTPANEGGWADSIEVAGRRWRLEITPTASFVAQQKTWQAWLVLAGGLLFVGLLGGVLLLVTGREARVAEAEAKYRDLYDNAPDMFISVRVEDRIVMRCNQAVAETLGVGKETIIGRPFIELYHPDCLESARAVFALFARTGEVADAELQLKGKDGQKIDVSLNVTAVRGGNGEIVESRSILRNATERKHVERERDRLLAELQSVNSVLEDRVRSRTSDLSAMLKEREVLLQEVNHRVKNNLQVIASLINLQMRQLDAGASRAALEECQNRVQTIALIHEKLYQSHDYVRVPFSDYARSLASNIFLVTGVSQSEIRLEFAIEDLALAVDKAIPCGLILNELITNSLKHAFPKGRGGTVHVELASLDAGKMRLAVRDDGVGLPADLDFKHSASLGLQLVRTFAEQLDADVQISGASGASFQFTFQADA